MTLMGCNKTASSLLMGAASCHVPPRCALPQSQPQGDAPLRRAVHCGRPPRLWAVVFGRIEVSHARTDNEAQDIDEHGVMVLRNLGLRGQPGHGRGGLHAPVPEVPAKGIVDRLRLGDVRTGGGKERDVPVRNRHLEASDPEPAPQRVVWQPPASPARNRHELSWNHAQQAQWGADLDFLVGGIRAGVPKDSH